jgi:hypothetical protein
MKSEIKIILEEGATNKDQGKCFEDLIRNILSSHQYEITSNINFTGMEIDLLAKHTIRNEILYVECKAKEKVSSTEIRNFCFNVDHKKADFGYFIRTKELESQAGGLVEEIKADPRYKKLTFIEPKEVIDILKGGRFIQEPNILQGLFITKRILSITYFGDFLIYIITKNSVLPTNFILCEAKDNKDITDLRVTENLKSHFDEILGLEQVFLDKNDDNLVHGNKSEFAGDTSEEFESISEVQESENWHDYLPASSKHFVGRQIIRNNVFDYFKNVLTSQTNRRIFYLTGKSGWGKSSLIAEIRGRCRNKHYKKKYFAYAVDSRSAISQNFVALAFREMIHKASSEGFIDLGLFSNNLNFTSNQELLSSDSVKSILDYLTKKKRILILIFDQFEDVFRKPNLFKSFYKFLSDVTDSRSNIIVGFSWKTEILIPSENEAYHFWQQAKEQAISFVVPEFGEKEIDGVIRQLENSVGKLSQELKRRIKENSQGLPWLTKKLCIHIYEQISMGIKPDRLIDENLNIQILFKNDLEKIKSDELSALKYIAKKAYDGNFFEISEIGDIVSESTIESLRDKRLIIRSGANYNIYWDIFRDYLVTNEIPPIGESYILRQGVNLCLEVFLLFKNNNIKMSIDDLLLSHPKAIGKGTLENILIELRNFGLVQKIEGEENYRISKSDIEVTKEGFVNFLTVKFQNYSPVLKLQKKNLKEISKTDITNILKETFKYEFKEKTWDSYSKTFIGWIQLSNSEFKHKLMNPLFGERRLRQSYLTSREKIMIRCSKSEIISALKNFKNNKEFKNPSILRDLFILGLISQEKFLTDNGRLISELGDKEMSTELLKLIQEIPKMKKIGDHYKSNQKLSCKGLLLLLPNDFFGPAKESSKLIYISKILTWFKEK